MGIELRLGHLAYEAQQQLRVKLAEGHVGELPGGVIHVLDAQRAACTRLSSRALTATLVAPGPESKYSAAMRGWLVASPITTRYMATTSGPRIMAMNRFMRPKRLSLTSPTARALSSVKP